MLKGKRLVQLISIVVGISLVVALVGVACAPPKPYPSRTVRIICPWGVGGGSDTFVRKSAPILAGILGVNVIVSNVTGSNELAAMADMMGQPADGYHICQITSSLPENTYGPEAKYKMLEDVIPLARMQYDPSTLFTYPGAPWKDGAELLDYIKAHPGEVRLACSFLGGSEGAFVNHFKRDGYEVAGLAYDTISEGYASVMGKHNQLLFEQYALVKGLVEAGKLIPILHIGDSRSVYLPDIPSTAEYGLEGYEYGEFRGFIVKAGTPEDIMQTLSEAVYTMHKTREWKGFMTSYGMDWETSFLPTEEAIKFFEAMAVAYGVIE